MSDYDAFARVYDEWSAHMTEDVDFYVSLAAESDGPVVELAVGNGRVGTHRATPPARPSPRLRARRRDARGTTPGWASPG
jgi:hypothetical protein